MTKRLEFSKTTKRKRYDFAKGVCEICVLPVRVGDEEYHHDKEAERGGSNTFENCRFLCKPCHSILTGKFKTEKARAEAQRAKHIGASKPKGDIKSPGFPQPKPKREPRAAVPGQPNLSRRFA